MERGWGRGGFPRGKLFKISASRKAKSLNRIPGHHSLSCCFAQPLRCDAHFFCNFPLRLSAQCNRVFYALRKFFVNHRFIE